VPTQPQVSYAYQSIGSNLNITNVKLSDRMVSFDLMVDVSLVEPTSGSALGPTFRRFTMQLAVAVRMGELTVVAVSSDRMSNETAKLSVLADVVR
jgi:hypothetical protein